MNLFTHLLRSLALTTLFSFASPIVIMGTILVLFSVMSYIPGCELIGQTGAMHLLDFLRVFGSGQVMEGVLVIGLVFGFVGALFEFYAFYHYQQQRDH